jgi:DNA polymerase-3 subunit alpha
MISIQNYTAYSIFAGTATPKKWIQQAKELGYTAFSFTDRSTMAGSIQLQKQCDEHGLHPIHGMDVYLTATNEKNEANKQPLGRILLYAKNETGFKNLIKINNLSHDRSKEGFFYYRARVPLQALIENMEGIICVVAEEIAHKIDGKTINYLKMCFNEDFYIGLNPLVDLEAFKARVFHDTNFQYLPVFNAIHPFEGNDHLIDALIKMDTGTNKVNTCNSKTSFCLPDPKNLQQVFSESEYDYLVSLGLGFQSKIEKFLVLNQYKMPPVLLDEPTKTYLEKKAIEGFRKKLFPALPKHVKTLTDLEQVQGLDKEYPFILVKNKDMYARRYSLKVYVERIKEEIEIIDLLSFQDYFYHIWDICRVAHESKLGFGPGRGSGAGSLYAYLLNITEVDSIRHEIPFERFLTITRKDLPDIDLDFSPACREHVRDYLKDKYGLDRVCNIGTYSRFKVTSTVKALAASMAYGIEADNGSIVAYDPQSLHDITDVHTSSTAKGMEELEEMRLDPKFERFYQQHEKWFKSHVFPLLDSCKAESIHAAGVVITPETFNNCVPLNYNSNQDTWTTQWEMMDVESYGYPKFDLLVVEALSVIAEAKRLIKQRHLVDVPEYFELPFDDEQALAIFKNVATANIFQYNTYSQKRYLKQLRADTFEDLSACIALIRPGPIAALAHDRYADKKSGKLELSYPHPDLETVLQDTYGELIYQEQMMRIAKDLAGFTGAESDALRKACGKKKKEDMIKWEGKFKEQMEQRGYPQDLADNLWDAIVAFASYSFNRGHSVAYALISYYQAYIKARFPVEYWAASLNYADTSRTKDGSVYDLKVDAEVEGIKFHFPNCEGFAARFHPADEDTIYWPLSVVPFVKGKSLNYLTDNDTRNSFDDFDAFFEATRLTDDNGKVKKVVNLAAVKQLVKIGFFDPWMKPWEAMQKFLDMDNPPTEKRQNRLPEEFLDESLEPISDPFFWQSIKNETFNCLVKSWKEVAPFDDKCRQWTEARIAKVPDGKHIFIGGEVQTVIRKYDKRGNPYATIIVEDLGEKHYVKCWSSFWDNPNLDIEKRRPRQGDLVEMVVKKSTWNDRIDLSMGDSDMYMRVVASPKR